MEATGVPEHLQTMESVNDLKTKIHELEEKNASALAAVERELKTRMDAISGDVVEEGWAGASREAPAGCARSSDGWCQTSPSSRQS